MVFYFSGTGNSKFAAEEISRLTEDDVFSINEALKHGKKTEKCQNAVIAVPTYAWRIPKVVSEWIKNNLSGKVKRIWFIMTCGGEIGNAAKYNRLLSNDIGAKYMGTCAILMPENYVAMFKVTEKEEAQKRIEACALKCKELAGVILKEESFSAPRNNLYDRFMSAAVNNGFYKKCVSAKGFFSASACTGCKKCVSVCPLNNISLNEEKRPVWNNNCTHCMACISYCPAGAIEYSKKTAGKKRYTFEGSCFFLKNDGSAL